MRRFVRYLGVLCLFLFSLTAQAQDLNLNSPINGNISSGSDRYNFIAQDGEVISFVVRALNNDFDPFITIQDLNGDTIIQHDDYDYPNSKDAIIEAFTAPYTGSYTLVVSGYGGTTGRYELLMLPGYSQVTDHTDFADIGSWTVVDLGAEEPPELSSDGETLRLQQAGIGQTAIALGIESDTETYYISSTITDISGRQGWRVGLVFNYQDDANFYQVLINQQGSWRLDVRVDGNETTLRDWIPHPAIRAGENDFTLGVLVNRGGYDVFYNNQYIGSVYDNSIRSGQVGVSLVTANAIGSTVSAHYDDLLITNPKTNPTIFPTWIVATNGNDIVRELEHRLVIPAGGETVFNIPESFVQNVTQGVSRFPIGNQEATNFAIGGQVEWAVDPNVLNGCGLVLRDTGDSDDYLLAYIDSTSGYGISRRDVAGFSESYFNNQLMIGQPPYHMLLIAYDDVVHYYLNGYFVHSLEFPTRTGAVGQAIVNFQATNTSCEYNNLWMWQFD